MQATLLKNALTTSARCLIKFPRFLSSATTSVPSLLDALRKKTANVKAVTAGIADDLLKPFYGDRLLLQALNEAHTRLDELINVHGESVVLRDELALMGDLQAGFVNFYDPGSIMPIVPLSARGPWVVTLHGAVIHDNGGYGMLGFGHNADFLMGAVARPHCMANIMTPAFSQHEFFSEWKKQVGFTRPTGNPYSRIMALNSGSEAVELSARLTDVHAKLMTDKGAVHEGRRSTMIVLEGSFYGRTYRPARLSHSCRGIYKQHLASFQHADCHLPLVVPPNDIPALRSAFAAAESAGYHVEAMYMEPVMGEGKPGEVVQREFYDAARSLTREAHSLLIVDSIQAALRAKGVLSIVDYPGFQGSDAPDMETYSKSLNAGQYPLSILALQEHVASKYVVGLYGNTMTANPRALDVAALTLRAVTPEVRRNIVERGSELQEKMAALVSRHPGKLTTVTGSGLLQAVHLHPDVPMFGGNHLGTPSFLALCRQAGIGIINAAHTIKFTSHFQLSSMEVDLLVAALERVTDQYSVPSKVEK